MKKSLGAKTLVLPTPVWLVAAYDPAGKPNAMVAAWCGVACSKPPALAVSLRSATYTHGCILARQAFTVSLPPRRLAVKADFFGMVSGREVDKFAAAGLTAERAQFVDAPFIAEFPLVVECRVLHVHELGLHTQFIGEIMDVKADESVLGEGGLPDIVKAEPYVFDTAGAHYFGLGEDLGKAFFIGKAVKA